MSGYTVTRFDNLGNRTAAATTAAAGSWTKLLTSARRQALVICCDPSGANSGGKLYVTVVARGATAPTIAVTDALWVINNGATLEMGAGPSIDVYVQSSSGTTGFAAQELM